MRTVSLQFWLFPALLHLILAPTAMAVTIDWVTIGDAGNACDTQAQGCFGSVAEIYRISRTEVTNAQYADFLNAAAAADPNGLYNNLMSFVSLGGGITRGGASGSYTYATISGREDMPVIHTTFYDALRFVNWLHNGQPIGVQGGSTTEGGAYTITAQGITDNSITRNVGAMVSLSSEDEWYKAAYYDPVSMTYNDYPAGSNSQTICAAITAAANRANCDDTGGDLTVVASYTGSASPYGIFDLGGNTYEWNEAILETSSRGTRGGGFKDNIGALAASNRNVVFGPTGNLGFRVTSPGSASPSAVPMLAPVAVGALGTLLTLAGIRRLRSQPADQPVGPAVIL